jgi:2-phosphosulfolactate phosphatase
LRKDDASVIEARMPILSTLIDAKRQTDVIVVIDAFRASNTIIELLARGAARVVPVRDEDAARALKKAHPDWLLLGERRGVRLAGFDGDNSPSNLPAGVAGKVVILSTSNGTRIIEACLPENDVLIGSFANADAVIAALRVSGCEAPSFWAVGLIDGTYAEEDMLCARYLYGLFSGLTPDRALFREEALQCGGATRLRGLDLHADLDLCTQFDRTAIVPRRAAWENGLSCLAI